ncbi:hypothetical protein ACWD6P_03020 [Streptomyces sp. NPDC002446]
MHTGGGFLAKTVVSDWDDDDHGRGHGRDHGRDHDKGGYGDHDKGGYGDHDKGGYGDHDKGGYGGHHRKPHGGIHTGGGGLATNSGMAAGSLLMVGGLGAGAYMLRRRSSGSAAA